MSNGNSGRFFVFEGIDGSGKTTQIQRLAERISALGYDIHETREPTDLPVGKMIRQILRGEIGMDNRAIAPLFVSDRLDHLTNPQDGLCNLMSQGKMILCDRYYFSSYAYHSVDMAMDWVIDANSVAADLLRPTATIFLDITPETAMDRITRGREATELFETKERLTQTREKYFQAFEKLKETERVIIVDGSVDEDSLSEAIWEQVKNLLD